MKKLSAFFVTIFTVATLYAAARPSLDGRAMVAQDGAMPRGLFARTVGYLPGDSVTVTNPLNGSIVDVLILGAIDPSEGVAILLSPEAAKQLGINDNSNVQVKITKRSGRLDEAASGSAILASDGADEVTESEGEVAKAEPEEKAETVEEAPEVAVENKVEEKPLEEAAAESAEVAKEEVAAVEDAAPVSQETPAEENVEVAQVPVPEEKVESEVVVEEPYEEVAYVGEPESETEKFTEKFDDNSFVSDVPEVVEVADNNGFDASQVEKVVFIEKPSDTPTTPLSEENVTEEVAAFEDVSPVVEEEVVVAENTESENKAEEVEPVNEEVFVADDKFNDAVEVAKVEEAAEAPAVTEAPEVVAESPVEENVAEVAEASPVSEPAPVEENEYSPIVLMPSEPNPPEPTEYVEETAKAPVVEKPIEVPATPAVDWKRHVVSGLGGLQSGKYYIQIATLREESNIASTIEKYGKNYPIVLVPLSSGTAYQVMIGALNVDEYGAVMERFKANGYKDLFLRKIK